MIIPMSVIHKFFGVCFFLFGPVCVWSQNDNTYVSRDAFYDSLEARARALSQRLADLSGTEPIPFERPPPTILSTRKPPPSNAQSAFDSLPGTPPRADSPVVPSAPQAPEPDDGTLYRADGTPVKIKEEVPEAPVKNDLPARRWKGIEGSISFSLSLDWLSCPPMPPLIDSMDLTDWVILFTPTSKSKQRLGMPLDWAWAEGGKTSKEKFISPMPLSVMILPRLPMVVLPLRYLYPVKSNFFKLVPELAMACLSAIQAGSELRGIRIRQKARFSFSWPTLGRVIRQQ